MCLIVYKEDNQGIFPNNDFKRAIKRNSDGLGFMFTDAGRVVVKKSLGTPQEQYELFKEVFDEDQVAMHLRLKTHGLRDEENLHPYKILSLDDGNPIDLYMMHNGIISCDTVESKKSDTFNFVEYYLKPMLVLNPDLVKDKYWQEMVETYIGKGNKLLFMNNKGEVNIYNQKQGEEKNKCWLSNTIGLDADPKGWEKAGIISPWYNQDDWEDYPYYGYNGYRNKTPLIEVKKDEPKKTEVTEDMTYDYIDSMVNMSLPQLKDMMSSEPDMFLECMQELLNFYAVMSYEQEEQVA